MRCNNCSEEMNDSNPEWISEGHGIGFCIRCVHTSKVRKCVICGDWHKNETIDIVDIYDEPHHLIEDAPVCQSCLDKSRVCEDCGLWMSWRWSWDYWNDYRCDSCVEDRRENNPRICEDCGRRITNGNFYTTNQGFVCNQCLKSDKWKICSRCGHMNRKKDFVKVGPGRKIEMCRKCYKKALDRGEKFSKIELQKKSIPMPNHRGYLLQEDCDRSVGSGWIAGKRSKEIPSDRLIGIELEALGGDPFSASDMLQDDIGIVYDGSIQGSSGKEFVTPPISGAKIKEYVSHLTSTVRRCGYKVNKSCGFHLHIDCNDIKNSGAKISRVIQTYYAIEDVLYGMLPPSRYVSSYSKPLKMFFKFNDFNKLTRSKLEDIWYSKTPIFEDVRNIVLRYLRSADPNGDSDLCNLERIQERKEVWKIWYSDRKFRNLMKKSFASNHSIASRYLGFNLHSMYHRGTIEIRHHSGTLNKMKIMNWIKINLAIVEYALNRFNKKDVISLSDTKYGFIKILRFSKMIGLKKPIVDYVMRRSKMFSEARMKDPSSQIDLSLEEDN